MINVQSPASATLKSMENTENARVDLGGTENIFSHRGLEIETEIIIYFSAYR